MIPNAEHWRTSLAGGATAAVGESMAICPFATPQNRVHVPYVGKRWVHQVVHYDREVGRLLPEQELPHRAGRRGCRRVDPCLPFYDQSAVCRHRAGAWWRKHSGTSWETMRPGEPVDLPA